MIFGTIFAAYLNANCRQVLITTTSPTSIAGPSSTPVTQLDTSSTTTTSKPAITIPLTTATTRKTRTSIDLQLNQSSSRENSKATSNNRLFESNNGTSYLSKNSQIALGEL